MGIQEMHISVLSLLQDLDTHSQRNVYPEQIDMALNWSIDEFVNSKIQRRSYAGQFGFFNDEVDTAALSPLIVPHRPLRVFPDDIDDAVFKVHLPADYRNFISLGARTAKKSCDVSAKSFGSEDVKVYIYTLKLKEREEELSEYYNDLTLTVGSTDYPLHNLGTSDPTSIIHIYNAILQASKRDEIPFSTSEIYWEKYPEGPYRQNCIIIKSFSRYQPSIILKQGDFVMSISEERDIVYPFVPLKETGNWRQTRRLSPIYRYTVESSAFERTHVESPIVYSFDNYLEIDSGKRFLLEQVALNYVRKPAKVSLSLGIDCDLPTDFHELICKEASATLALSINDPNWQARVQDIKNK